MVIDLFVVALSIVSILTNLTVESLKKILDKRHKIYSSNALAAICSVIISLCVAAIYIVIADIAVSAKIIAEVLILMYLSFLVATNGYDKVIQSIKQIQNAKGDKT